MGKLTLDEVNDRLREKINKNCSFELIDYKSAKSEVEIKCNVCGYTWRKFIHRVINSDSFQNCQKCREKKYAEDFFEKAKKIHVNENGEPKYRYYDNYKTSRIKIAINCPKHGDFNQTPNEHIQGKGCPLCAKEKHDELKKEESVFISQLSEKIRNEYDFSKFKYINCRTNVCLICHKKDENGNEHGEFWKRPDALVRGQYCPKCSREDLAGSQRFTKEEAVKRFNSVHNFKYSYEKTEYVDMHHYITITCPIHGDFVMLASNHALGYGCPKCDYSRLESFFASELDKRGIKYVFEKRFDFFEGRKYSIDFYLPDYNIGIECQGGQHFSPCSIFGGEERFKLQIERDLRKKQLCEENGVKLLYYTNVKIPDDFNLYHVETDIEKLLKNIQKHVD